MARASATMSDRVIDHFQTTDLKTAEEDLRVAKRIVGNRLAVIAERANAGKPKPKAKAKPKAKTPAVAAGTGPGTGMVSMAATTNK